MKTFSIFLILLLTGAKANAMWVEYSDTDLIANSDLIVFGEITGTKLTKLSDGQGDLNTAVVLVTESLKGAAASAEVLLAIPSPEIPRSSSDIFYRPGQKGLWFFRVRNQLAKDHVYLADHPQRFIPADQTQKIEAFKNLLRCGAKQPR